MSLSSRFSTEQHAQHDQLSPPRERFDVRHAAARADRRAIRDRSHLVEPTNRRHRTLLWSHQSDHSCALFGPAAGRRSGTSVNLPWRMVMVEKSSQDKRIGELVQLEFKAADWTPIPRLRERTWFGLALSQGRVADWARPRHDADRRTASKRGNSTSVGSPNGVRPPIVRWNSVRPAIDWPPTLAP